MREKMKKVREGGREGETEGRRKGGREEERGVPVECFVFLVEA